MKVVSMETKFAEIDAGFDTFRKALIAHFKEMHKDAERLFRVNIDKDTISNTYLESFSPEWNPIFRERRFFDCQACLHFIRSCGSIVAIREDCRDIISIWDFTCGVTEFDKVAKALSDYVHHCFATSGIKQVYLTSNPMGLDHNMKLGEDGKTIKWEHLYVPTPAIVQARSDEIGTMLNEFTTNKTVLENSMTQISLDACETVMELIRSDSLYRGLDYKDQLQKFIDLHKQFQKWIDERDVCTDSMKQLWFWQNSLVVPASVNHIKNTAIGTLLLDVAEGLDLDAAVTKYEKVVAPEKYKRPKPIYTTKMIEQARKQIEELGYLDSLPRRFACLDDIRINNVLFSNRDVAKKVFGISEGAGFFDDMTKSVQTIDPKKFSRCTEISIEDFLANVVPTAKEIDLLFEGRLEKNLVSLIAPKNPDAKSMFGWKNGFSWSYKGNMTDSSLKANVAKAGGNVTGDLRFSIQWNDGDEWDQNDLDAHCQTPRKHIYFGDKVEFASRGNLDIDIISPKEKIPAVENICFPTRDTMVDGQYEFSVHCYTCRGGKSGFRAEIEFDGQIYSYDHTQPMRQDETITVAIITKQGNSFTIDEKLKSSMSTREIWGIQTNQFVPVSVIMNSPNYWKGEPCRGAKHTFFMIKGCINNERPNGFFNEYLNDDFKDYRRVMEALGTKAAVEDREDQLSGIGVSHTQHNYVFVHVKGMTDRVMKVVF